MSSSSTLWVVGSGFSRADGQPPSPYSIGNSRTMIKVSQLISSPAISRVEKSAITPARRLVLAVGAAGTFSGVIALRGSITVTVGVLRNSKATLATGLLNSFAGGGTDRRCPEHQWRFFGVVFKIAPEVSCECLCLNIADPHPAGTTEPLRRSDVCGKPRIMWRWGSSPP